MNETAISPLERQDSLGEQAYERLKESLLAGQFEPGVKFTVRSIAELLQVSTTPARDAINRLIAAGALVSRGPKTIVLPNLGEAELREITAIRLQVEALAAENAVNFVTDDDIEALEVIQEKLVHALDHGQFHEVLSPNKAFHFSVYSYSRMPRLMTIIESLWLQIGPSFNQLYPEFAITKRGVANHQWILGGLRDRDGATVRSGIEADLRGGYRRLSKIIKTPAP